MIYFHPSSYTITVPSENGEIITASIEVANPKFSLDFLSHLPVIIMTRPIITRSNSTIHKCNKSVLLHGNSKTFCKIIIPLRMGRTS